LLDVPEARQQLVARAAADAVRGVRGTVDGQLDREAAVADGAGDHPRWDAADVLARLADELAEIAGFGVTGPEQARHCACSGTRRRLSYARVGDILLRARGRRRGGDHSRRAP